MKPGNRLLRYGAKSCRIQGLSRNKSVTSKDGLMSRCHGWQGATIYSGLFSTILRCQNASIPPVLPRFDASSRTKNPRSILPYLFLDSPSFLEDERGL